MINFPFNNNYEEEVTDFYEEQFDQFHKFIKDVIGGQSRLAMANMAHFRQSPLMNLWGGLRFYNTMILFMQSAPLNLLFWFWLLLIRCWTGRLLFGNNSANKITYIIMTTCLTFSNQ